MSVLERRLEILKIMTVKRKSNVSTAKGGWLMLFAPGSYNCSPARQKGPFKLCSALREHGYFRSQHSLTAPLSRAHSRLFSGICPFG